MGLASKPIGASLRIGIQKTLPIFVTAIVFSFFINLLMFVSPLYMLQIYDRVVNSRSFTTLIAITVLAGFLLLVYAALEALAGYATPQESAEHGVLWRAAVVTVQVGWRVVLEGMNLN